MNDAESTEYMNRENLMEALRTAIYNKENDEKTWEYHSDSSLLAGWKAALNVLDAGGRVVITE